MKEFVRWAFLTGVVTSAALFPAPGAEAETRAAVMDTAWDTRPFLDEMRASGIQVVGRYLARCPQPERHIPQKRLIDQGPLSDSSSEVRRLLDGGFAILSIYQYNNDSKNKFRGRDRDGKPLPDRDCKPTSRARTPEGEAELDATAAVKQAKALGQPAGSAIYFGVDIAFNASDSETRKAMLTYMKKVRQIVRRAGFQLGAYGNGDALRVLQSEKLIDHAWLSASRAYPGTSDFHNSGKWHLFQNGVNLEFFTGSPGACRRGLPLDVNVKNAAFADRPLGFWRREGPVRLAPKRTRAVFKARRFACDGDARIRRNANSGPRDLLSSESRCRGNRAIPHPKTVDFANSARIGRRSGDLVEVDYDDDGTFDGWTSRSNLTSSFAQKPQWIFSKSARSGARCR
ncbi:MAG: DUF1906 domain-containing protein [Pseudomonadota bacterium]